MAETSRFANVILRWSEENEGLFQDLVGRLASIATRTDDIARGFTAAVLPAIQTSVGAVSEFKNLLDGVTVAPAGPSLRDFTRLLSEGSEKAVELGRKTFDAMMRGEEATKKQIGVSKELMALRDRMQLQWKDILGARDEPAAAALEKEKALFDEYDKAVIALTKDLRDGNIAQEEAGEQLSGLTKQRDKDLDQLKEEEKRRKKEDKGIKGLGMRYSWFGYRLMSVGKIILKWITKPIKDIMGLFSGFENIMETAAWGVEGAGLTAEETSDLFGDFVLTAIDVKKAMGELYIEFMRMAVDVGPTIIDIIKRITEKFRIFWEDHGPEVKTALEGIVDKFEDLYDAIEPNIKLILNLVKELGPLAPLMIVLGMGMFFATPLISAASGAFKALNTAVVLLATKIPLVSSPLLGMGIALGIIAYAIAGVILWWDEIVEDWKEIVQPAIDDLVVALEGLGEAIWDTEDPMEMLKNLTYPVKVAVEGLFEVFAGGIDTVTDLINILTTLIDLLPDFDTIVGGIAKNPLQDLIDWWVELSKEVDTTTDSLETLEEQVDDMFEDSIGTTIIKDISPAIKELDRFRDEMVQLSKVTMTSPTPAAPVGIAPTAPTTQHVTVYSEVIITGPVSSEVELVGIENAVNRAIGDALRRRLAPRF